jgi:hypothetical protein
VQILVGKGLTRGKRTNAVKGTLDIGAALGRLLYGTGLEVVATSGTVITLGQRDRSGQAGAVQAAHPRDMILVEARRVPVRMTRRSTAVVDAVRYDDVSTLAGSDGSVVEQLVTLPGVTGIEEGDTPRFISIRGIAANLNATTIDGLSIASIGSDGDGSRQVNLQLLPSNMSAGNEVYKSFTPNCPVTRLAVSSTSPRAAPSITTASTRCST